MTSPKWVLKTKPFSAQEIATINGADRDGYNFFMEQGMGKTLTLLNNFMLRRQTRDVRKLLVLAPNSFKGGWLKEARSAGITLPMAAYQADHPEEFMNMVKKEPEWIGVLNYESAAKFAEKYPKLIVGREVMIAADESIKLKGFKTETSRASVFLADHCDIRRNLSGKPVSQGPHDLWAQLSFIKKIPNRLNYYGFRNRYCKMGGFKMKQVVGAANEEELRQILERCSFLARKKDWLDLPEKNFSDIEAQMAPRQAKLYKQMEQELVADILAGRVVVEQAITRDIKLRQIMSGFIYSESGEAEWFMPINENPRYQAMRDHQDMIVGKSVIVTWYRETYRALIEQLQKEGRNPAWIVGGMSVEEVEEQKRRFNEDDTVMDLVVQQRAAKYGHTMLGTPSQPCSTMYMYEQSYSLDDRSQIEDRIHRIGQVWPCSYLDFRMGKLDRAVIRALQRKESVAAAILGYANEFDVGRSKAA